MAVGMLGVISDQARHSGVYVVIGVLCKYLLLPCSHILPAARKIGSDVFLMRIYRETRFSNIAMQDH